MKQKLLTAPVTIKAYRWIEEATPNGTRGYSQEEGTRTATVELWIDLAAVLQDLGAKALGNRSKKAKLHQGDIEAVVVGTITKGG